MELWGPDWPRARVEDRAKLRIRLFRECGIKILHGCDRTEYWLTELVNSVALLSKWTNVMLSTAPYTPNELAASLQHRFEVAYLIDKGGQALVYRAKRSSTIDGSVASDDVALKLYVSRVHDERVEREIGAMGKIRHPSLAGIVEHGTVTIRSAELRYVAYEFIEGGSLGRQLKLGPLPAKAVACIGRDISAAIAEIWRHRIVHRDVKPNNVMLRTGEREAVLIDLGVARHLHHASITVHGSTYGTIGYMSPEQFLRAERQLTCKSDIFSLGVVLQEGLSGLHPTHGDQSVLAQAPPKTADICPSTPAYLAALIDQMLAVRAPFRPDPELLKDEFARVADLL